MNDQQREQIATIDRALLKALLRAAMQIEGRLERTAEAYDLSLPKLNVLQHLVLAGGTLPLGQLAEQLACVRSNVTQLIDRLQADGLVRREPDPGDRRSILAVITEQGRSRWQQTTAAVSTAEQQILGTLSSEQRQQLYRLLACISGQAD